MIKYRNFEDFEDSEKLLARSRETIAKSEKQIAESQNFLRQLQLQSPRQSGTIKAARKPGRPGNSPELFQRVKVLRASGLSWPNIAAKIAEETGITRSPTTYRTMMRGKFTR